MARGPRCFRSLIFRLSGPVELLFLVSFMACVVWWLEMRMGSQLSFFVCLLTSLFVLLVACFTVFTNCLLKAVAFCMGVLAGLLLKSMFLLVCYGDFLLMNLFSVFQKCQCSVCGPSIVQVCLSIGSFCGH